MGYLMAGPEAADSAAASVPDTASSPFHQPQHPRLARFWLILRWTAVSLVCAWMALCTAVGPLYRANSSITSFRAHNWILLITFFAGYMGTVGIAVNISQAHSRIRGIWRCAQSYILDTVGPAAVRLCRDSGMMLRGTVRKVAVHLGAGRSAPDRNAAKTSAKDAEWKPSGRKGKAKRIAGIAAQAIQHAAHLVRSNWRPWIVSHTRYSWQIACVLAVVWGIFFIFIPTVFSADAISQWSEVNRWAYFMQGGKPAYSESFNVADIYPIAHYLWPATSTYLTNQHNIVLTLFTGGILELSNQWTGSKDWGLIIASGLQAVFALFCVSVTMARFFRFARPAYTYGRANVIEQRAPAGPWTRLIILAFFAFNPLPLFSISALTKSPVFAFAFLWWFGQWYEIFAAAPSVKISRRLTTGLFISSGAMLISAKYAVYIIAVQCILVLIASRARWRTWLIGLAIPLVIFQVGLNIAVGTGAIISGDPIESRGVQIQQIARTMKLAPLNISTETKNDLSPIFNLYAMGITYFPNDADKVKSSGTDSKIETYKWRTVTAKDMEKFNKAWLELGKRNPVIYYDAFMAKVYGYFDINDEPYTGAAYYIKTPQLDTQSQWLRYYFPQVRVFVQSSTDTVSSEPILGWLIHGNFYVIICLLLMCAEFILKRWKYLLRQFPLLMLMGVMVMSPANNFDRHMLPVAFVCLFILINFAYESRRHIARVRRALLM